jgi:regulator of replication initiation timing
MEDLSLQLRSIQDKLQLLLKQQQLLQKENQRLKKDLDKALMDKDGQDSILEGLKQQLESAAIGGAKWSPADKQQMEKRIDGYLKEIEKCLALLNS